jgi:hypothetical protein
MVRDGSFTIDEMLEEVRALGGEVKRSAVGDYKKTMESRLVRMREAQEVARVWIDRLGESPDSQMGQLVAEMVKTVAFRTLSDLDDSGETVTPGDLMLVAKALQSTASAQKVDHEFRKKLRDEFQAEMKSKVESAAGEVQQIARNGGLSDEAAAQMREAVLGVVG